MIRNLAILAIAISFAANVLCDGTASAQTFRGRHFQIRKHARGGYSRAARGSKFRFASQRQFTHVSHSSNACPEACCEYACETSRCSSFCIPPFDPLGLFQRLFPMPCCFSPCGCEPATCGCGGGDFDDVYDGEASLEGTYPFGEPDYLELTTPDEDVLPEPEGKRPAKGRSTAPPAPPKAPVDDPLKNVSSPVKRDLQFTPSFFKP